MSDVKRTMLFRGCSMGAHATCLELLTQIIYKSIHHSFKTSQHTAQAQRTTFAPPLSI